MAICKEGNTFSLKYKKCEIQITLFKNIQKIAKEILSFFIWIIKSIYMKVHIFSVSGNKHEN